jgi:hypothetical protein
MAKTTKTEVQRALLATASEREVAGGRAYALAVTRRTSKRDYAAKALVEKWMKQTGFDTRALAALQRQQRVEADRELAKQRAKDAKRPSRRSNLAHVAVAHQARTFQQFAAKRGFFPFPSVTLSRPDLILAEPDVKILVDSRIARFDSSAKILVDTKRSGVDKLSFIYPWQSDNPNPVVIDAVTFLSASGHLHLRQSGVLTSSIGVMRVTSQIEALSLDPSPTSLQKEVRGLGGVAAVSKPFWFDGNHDETLSAALNLSVTHCIVPGLARVLFVVSVSVDCDFDPGRAVADLASGNFGIRCPLVVVSVRGEPPPSILG